MLSPCLKVHALAVVASVGLSVPVLAAPSVTSVSPRALQSGSTTTLTIDGANLLPAPQLLMSLPGMKQSLRAGATDKRVQIEVTLEPQTPAGMCQFRLANETGLSAPVILSVDALPQAAFTDRVAALPIALNGNLTGTTVLRAALAGKAGQRLVADVEARRLGSALNPVVRLYDANRVQLAYAQTAANLAGDARLDVVLPRDGEYSVEVHDALYRGGNPGFFRLKIGELHYADVPFPLGVQRGAKSLLEFASTNLPSDAKVELEGLANGPTQPTPWPAVPATIGGRPWVVVSELPEVVETAETASQPIKAPAAVNGRLSKPGEEDKFQIEVTAGMKLRFDMLAARAGSPLDGVLSIRNAQGGQLANNDDRPTTSDPGLEFTVPAGTTSLIVAVRDLHGRGGSAFVYRVAIADAGQPDFSLVMQEDRIEIPQGGTALVKVRANRAGYNGPIRLSFDGLPAGIQISGGEIPAGSSDALVSFTSVEASPVQTLVRLTGRSDDGAVERVAEFPETAPTRYQPFLRTELAAATTPQAPLQVVWEKPSTEGALPLGGSVTSDVKTVRREGIKGQVRLSLISTQTIPKKNVNNQQVDDLDRAVRLDGTPLIAGEESQALTRVLIPGDLPITSYDLAIKAELLAADGKTVIASTVSPARRFKPVKPSLSLEVTGTPMIEARAGAGETGKLVGKLVRSAGFDQPVTLSLAGLPKGVQSPKHIVAGNQTDFEFPLTFPFGTAAADLGDVKLVASSRLNEKTELKASNEVPLGLKIVAGEQIAPEQPLAVFEDQPELAASLSQTGGSATLATDTKFSGTACLRVKPEQSSNPAIPGLSLKIRQYPGSGEYRYLRFAWRKEGGKIICLQVGHDGKFGPTPGNQNSFRYHAGPGPECYGASLAVDNNIPREFTVVTRDLFADFGEFTFTGLGLSVFDGNGGLFDHIYLARRSDDFQLVQPK